MPLRERSLVVVHLDSIRGDQTLAIEERDPRARLVRGQAFGGHRLGEELGHADRGGARAQEEEPLPRQRSTGDSQCAEKTGEGDRRGALDVVVEAADAVAVALQMPDRVIPCPIFELDQRMRELGLHRTHELVDERVQLLVRRAGLLDAEVERVGQQRFVVRSRIDQHGKGELRRDAADRGVQRELADRDPHAVRAEVAETQDPFAAGNYDAADIALRPVA